MKDKKGFTLVEILITITILVVVAGIFSVNMINTVNKNKENEHDSMVSLIESAAEAYVSANESLTETLYTEKAYIDVTIGELRTAGYIDEDLTDSLTGETVSDSYVVRVSVSNGEVLTYEYVGNDTSSTNTTSYTFVAQDYYINYSASITSNTWCNSTSKTDYGPFYGQVDSYSTKDSLMYMIDSSGNYVSTTKYSLSVTSCNVNPQKAGTYSITYSYVDPGTGETQTGYRTVYVMSSSGDVLSFDATINGGSMLAAGTSTVNIAIVATSRSGSVVSTTYSTVAELESAGYTISNLDTSIGGTRTAIISYNGTNSDGSIPASVSAEYTVSDKLTDFANSVGSANCDSDNNCYITGTSADNYVLYGSLLFRLYYYNQDTGTVKLIYYTNFQNSAYYGYLGTWYPSSCGNSGRYYYTTLGGASYLQDDSIATMDKQLNNFYSKLTSTSFLQNQTFSAVSSVSKSTTTTVSKKVSLLTLEEYKKIANCTDTISISLPSANSYVSTYCSGKNYLTQVYNGTSTNSASSFWLLDYWGGNVGAKAYSKGTTLSYMYDYYVSISNSVAAIGIAGGYSALNTNTVSNYTSGVRPTIMLVNATITGGNGTYTAPYVVG